MTRNPIKSHLQSIDLRPTRQRGQNFAADPALIEGVLKFAGDYHGRHVLEIGPGLGALTEKLSGYEKLTLIEIESKFCSELAAKFPDAQIINQDVRTVDFSKIGKNMTVFGNVPYSISTDIVFHLIANAQYCDRAILLLQKEFANRMAAPSGGKDFGVLSVAVQLECDTRLGQVFSGQMFYPTTQVDSRLIELVFRGPQKFGLTAESVKSIKRVVKASFAKRRKKIINSLKASGFFNSVEGLQAAFQATAIDPGRRAETLSIQEFIHLGQALALQQC